MAQSTDTPQVQEQALPGARVSVDAPIEAFGGGQAAQNLTNATEQVGQGIEQVALEQKKQADQVAFMAADRQLSQLQTKLQVQASQMLGKDAAQAPDVVGDAWKKGIEDIQKGLSNDQQKMAVSHAANYRFDTLDKHVQFHVADQLQKYDDQETSAYFATSKQNIALNADDDDTIKDELGKQAATFKDWAARKGIPEGTPQYQEKLNEVLSPSHQAVIESRLNSGDNDGAQEYFKDNKSSMTAEAIEKSETQIENADVTSKGLALYDKVKRFQLSDGSPDEDKMRASVMAQTDGMSSKRQLKVWDLVKARANEDFANATKQQVAIDRSFMNAAIDGRKNGTPMSEAMKLAESFSTDETDQAAKEDAVRKIYAPPTESNPQTYVALWEKVQQGQGNKQDIDQALNSNDLSVKDWTKLREEFLTKTVEGKNPVMENTFERVKTLAENKFGSNKENVANFLYEMHQERMQGKSPDEIWKSANDKMKGDPSTGIWGFFQKAQWKSDLQRSDAGHLAMGVVTEDLGKDTVSAITDGLQRTGIKNPGPSDIDSFAAQLGGWEELKSPRVKNAIQVLKNGDASRGIPKNSPATAANIKAVLSAYASEK